MESEPQFRVRRVYDPPESADGLRVLVDRLWPRGLAKERAALHEWLKGVTPSGGLRTEFHAGRMDFAAFRSRYLAELAEPEQAAAVDHLLDLARTSTVTLVTAVKDPEHSHIPVLTDQLERRRSERNG